MFIPLMPSGSSFDGDRGGDFEAEPGVGAGSFVGVESFRCRGGGGDT